MDSKNVIAAIALSTAVIVLYSLFFIPEKTSTNQNKIEKEKVEQDTDAPSIEKKETIVSISRDELRETQSVLEKEEEQNPNLPQIPQSK